MDSSKNQIITRYFDEFRYDLAKVGRYKFNRKLNVIDRLLNQTLAEDIKVNGEVTIKDVQKLRNGVIIDGIKTKKARVKLKSVDKKKSTSILEITIHEGKNHQIKKMFESLGYKVTKLRREKYANLDLKGLLPGEYRPLTVKEVKILYSLCKKK